MNLLLFFYAVKPTFVAALITCDCAQKVVETLLAQSWHDDGKFTNQRQTPMRVIANSILLIF
jgi:hypothetical protein